MRYLGGPPHTSAWMVTMNNQTNIALAKPARPSIGWETSDGTEPRRLEVNVIFTDAQATGAALKTAGELARDLGACIRVRAAIAVPYALPLEKPPVSPEFIEKVLCSLIARLDLAAFEPSVFIYLCRNRVEALLQALKPNSVVVVCGRKHWWPTAERRLANALRAKGHRVLFVSLEKEPKAEAGPRREQEGRPGMRVSSSEVEKRAGEVNHA
jgi:hypothetical protein